MCEHCSPETIAGVVEAVRQFREAKLRKDFPTRSGVTFFSVHDIWTWQARGDACPLCDPLDGQQFTGQHIRAKYPYLIVLDENTLGGQGYLGGGKAGAGLRHPNCRCILVRRLDKPEDEPEPKKLQDPKQILFDKTKDKWGTTNDYRKAGWILPDGTMLDFTDKDGKHIDHSTISQVAGYGGQRDPVRNFQQKGGIRIRAFMAGREKEVGISIDISGHYTDKQLNKIYTAVNTVGKDYFAWDIHNGYALMKTKGKKYPSAVDVKDFIDTYQDLRQYVDGA